MNANLNPWSSLFSSLNSRTAPAMRNNQKEKNSPMCGRLADGKPHRLCTLQNLDPEEMAAMNSSRPESEKPLQLE